MTVIDVIDALAIEPNDYIEINGNTVIVSSVEDDGDVVLVFGYSTITGDNVVEETSAFTAINLIVEDD